MISRNALVAEIEKVGVGNVVFLVHLSPIRSVFGFVRYRTSDDPKILVPMAIDREQWDPEHSNTIRLCALEYNRFGSERFYLDDLGYLLLRGEVTMLVSSQLLQEQDEAARSYAEVEKRLVVLRADGRWRSDEADALVDKGYELWGQMTPDQRIAFTMALAIAEKRNRSFFQRLKSAFLG